MTALMGTTGAGKTTLMDLLACRKNSAPALAKHLLQHLLALLRPVLHPSPAAPHSPDRWKTLSSVWQAISRRRCL